MNLVEQINGFFEDTETGKWYQLCPMPLCLNKHEWTGEGEPEFGDVPELCEDCVEREYQANDKWEEPE